jgi:hypothetical protein
VVVGVKAKGIVCGGNYENLKRTHCSVLPTIIHFGYLIHGLLSSSMAIIKWYLKHCH